MMGRYYAGLLSILMLLTTLSPDLHAAAPPSPAKLNITPVYHDLLLPNAYVPKVLRVEGPAVEANAAKPPSKSGYSQRLIWEVPYPSMGNTINPKSNVDDWQVVSLSGMRIYPTIQDAKGYFAWLAHTRNATRGVAMGDEAMFRPWEENAWKSYTKSHDKNHQWDSRKTAGVVRVGRTVFEIQASGYLKIDRVDADVGGKGFKSFQGFITVKEAPTRDELESLLKEVVRGVRSYADTMGWLKDGPIKKEGNVKVVPGVLAPPGDASDAATGKPHDDTQAPVTPGQAAGATAAAGILAVLGSLLFSRSMGVDLTRVKEAMEMLLNLSGQPVAAPPPPTPQPEVHNDGDVNADGDVWSENSGWVSQADYERDVATRGLIQRVNSGVDTQPDTVARDLGRTWSDSRQKLEDMRAAGRYVELSTQLAENFGSAEEKTWCRDFILRHAQAGPDGYAIDPETARQMYAGLKKQMVTADQIANLAEAQYQAAVADELGRKGAIVAQIRDNATRVNRVLAKCDPTGTGAKIVGFQQGVYGAIDGYEQGGISGAAEAVALTVADNYTQGYASGNYHALKEAYAEQGISDQSLAERLAKANFQTANNKYNVLDHAGKAVNSLLEGDYGAAVDSTLDAFDAKDSLKEDYGKARDWATGANAEMPAKTPVPAADNVPDAPPDAGKKSLGTLRRESFEETRKSMDQEIKMMQELNRVADIPDPAQRQTELVRIRNSDPSTFNVVQKQLHPDTAGAVTDTNRVLSDKVVERQAQILKEMGYEPGVRLTGKAGGADTDGYWTLKDGNGQVLPDGETRKMAGDALKKASDEVLQPLGTDADQMGHKIMNDSPEKFAADPNDLGIKSRDGRLEEGKLVFDDHAQSGDHWKQSPREAALTAPKERIADGAMTRDNAASLGEVMKTKTAHLDEIARSKGAVSESDMRDLARELTKTNNRTFLPMAEKAGVKPSAEYRDLMQKLMLVKDGDISSSQLPPRSEIDRIIAENVGKLTDAIKEH